MNPLKKFHTSNEKGAVNVQKYFNKIILSSSPNLGKGKGQYF